MLKTLFFALLIASALSIDLALWERFDTGNSFMAIKNNVAWRARSTGGNGFGNPSEIWSSTTQSWVYVPGNCVRMAIDGANLYCMNAQDTLWIRGRSDTTGSWTQSQYPARDLKVGSNNAVYFVGNNSQNSPVYQLNGIAVLLITGGLGTRVAVMPDNSFYLVNSLGQIYKFSSPGGYTQVMGEDARDIWIGSDGLPVIVTTTTSTDGTGYVIKKLNGSGQWVTIPGIGGTSLALDARNNMYVVTSSSEVYRPRGVLHDFCPSKLLTFKM